MPCVVFRGTAPGDAWSGTWQSGYADPEGSSRHISAPQTVPVSGSAGTVSGYPRLTS